MSDDALDEVHRMLATFVAIKGMEFDRATWAAMAVSLATGMSKQEAAWAVGRLLDRPDNLKAERVGVVFTTVQKAKIRELSSAGDIAGAQTLILDEVEAQFGSAA